jgi:hypothetical protein
VHGDLLVAHRSQQAQQQDIGQRLARPRRHEDEAVVAIVAFARETAQQLERRCAQRDVSCQRGRSTDKIVGLWIRLFRNGRTVITLPYAT